MVREQLFCKLKKADTLKVSVFLYLIWHRNKRANLHYKDWLFLKNDILLAQILSEQFATLTRAQLLNGFFLNLTHALAGEVKGFTNLL